MQITIINGPNLNLLGKREPDVYGSQSFEQFFAGLRQLFPDVQFDYFQSNIEGELIDALQKAGFTADGIILNPGGYTHTSVAIGDAIAAIRTPVIEVHLSDPMTREAFRHLSYVGMAAIDTVQGLGPRSYLVALEKAAEL